MNRSLLKKEITKEQINSMKNELEVQLKEIDTQLQKLFTHWDGLGKEKKKVGSKGLVVESGKDLLCSLCDVLNKRNYIIRMIENINEVTG